MTSPVSISNQSGIQDIQNTVNDNRIQNNDATFPRNPELGNVKAGKALKYAGRIALGILTLGISEGIRAIVQNIQLRLAAAPRINRTENTRIVYNMNNEQEAKQIKAGFLLQLNSKLRKPLSDDEQKIFNFDELTKEFDKILNQGGKLERKSKKQENAANLFLNNTVEILNKIHDSKDPEDIKDLLRKEFLVHRPVKNQAQFEKFINLTQDDEDVKFRLQLLNEKLEDESNASNATKQSICKSLTEFIDAASVAVKDTMKTCKLEEDENRIHSLMNILMLKAESQSEHLHTFRTSFMTQNNALEKEFNNSKHGEYKLLFENEHSELQKNVDYEETDVAEYWKHASFALNYINEINQL